MEIKRTGLPAQTDASSIPQKQSAQSTQNSKTSDEIVPYDSQANLFLADGISTASAKAQETQALLENILQTASKTITDGAKGSEFEQKLSEELQKAGVNVDSETLNQLTDAISKGGKGASALSMYLMSVITDAATGYNGVKSQLTEISQAVFSNGEDHATLVRSVKMDNIAEALDEFLSAVATQHESADALGKKIQEIKEKIEELRDTIIKQEKMLAKLQELLPQMLDALGNDAGKCLKNVSPSLELQQVDLVSELLKKVVAAVESESDSSIPVSDVNAIKAILAELMAVG
jgi:oligoendopeptidase F